MLALLRKRTRVYKRSRTPDRRAKLLNPARGPAGEMMSTVSARRGVELACTSTWFTADVASYVGSPVREGSWGPLSLLPFARTTAIFQGPCARTPSPLNHATTSRRESGHCILITDYSLIADPPWLVGTWVIHAGSDTSARHLLAYIRREPYRDCCAYMFPPVVFFPGLLLNVQTRLRRNISPVVTPDDDVDKMNVESFSKNDGIDFRKCG